MKRSNPFESLRSLKQPKEKQPKQSAPAHRIVNDEIVTLSPENCRKSSRLPLMLLRLQKHQSIYFQGCIQLAPILGSIEVLGATLSSQGDFVTSGSLDQVEFHSVYSPSTNSLLALKSIEFNTKIIKNETKSTSLATKEELKEIMELMHHWTDPDYHSIVVVKELNSGIEGIESILPTMSNCFHLQDSNLSIRGFDAIDPDNGSIPIFKVSRRTEEALEDLTSDPKEIICMVGNKNTGKSSMARFITNKFISTQGQVAYLECDVGQPEFTPPGVISLHLLKNPILGPPFTHHLQPELGLFYGSYSPKTEPDLYLQLLIEMLEYYRKHYSYLPLVVNTCGWLKGIGYELLQQFLIQLEPTSVVYMANISRNINLSHFLGPLNPKIVEVLAVVESDLKKIKQHASDYRSISTICYFLQDGNKWNFSKPLCDQKPYRVPWSCLKIKFMNDVPFSQSMNALNGTIVGLVIDRTNYHAVNATDSKIALVPANTPTRQNCVGLGLIRAIDMAEECFYILSPIQHDLLRNVNMIIRGDLDIPSSLITHGYERMALPYITNVEADGIGSVEHKNRHLGRRKNAT